MICVRPECTAPVVNGTPICHHDQTAPSTQCCPGVPSTDEDPETGAVLMDCDSMCDCLSCESRWPNREYL